MAKWQAGSTPTPPARFHCAACLWHRLAGGFFRRFPFSTTHTFIFVPKPLHNEFSDLSCSLTAIYSNATMLRVRTTNIQHQYYPTLCCEVAQVIACESNIQHQYYPTLCCEVAQVTACESRKWQTIPNIIISLKTKQPLFWISRPSLYTWEGGAARSYVQYVRSLVLSNIWTRFKREWIG